MRANVGCEDMKKTAYILSTFTLLVLCGCSTPRSKSCSDIFSEPTAHVFSTNDHAHIVATLEATDSKLAFAVGRILDLQHKRAFLWSRISSEDWLAQYHDDFSEEDLHALDVDRLLFLHQEQLDMLDEFLYRLEEDTLKMRQLITSDDFGGISQQPPAYIFMKGRQRPSMK